MSKNKEIILIIKALQTTNVTFGFPLIRKTFFCSYIIRVFNKRPQPTNLLSNIGPVFSFRTRSERVSIPPPRLADYCRVELPPLILGLTVS